MDSHGIRFDGNMNKESDDEAEEPEFQNFVHLVSMVYNHYKIHLALIVSVLLQPQGGILWI